MGWFNFLISSNFMYAFRDTSTYLCVFLVKLFDVLQLCSVSGRAPKMAGNWGNECGAQPRLLLLPSTKHTFQLNLQVLSKLIFVHLTRSSWSTVVSEYPHFDTCVFTEISPQWEITVTWSSGQYKWSKQQRGYRYINMAIEPPTPLGMEALGKCLVNIEPETKKCEPVCLVAQLFSFGHLSWARLDTHWVGNQADREKQCKSDLQFFYASALGIFTAVHLWSCLTDPFIKVYRPWASGYRMVCSLQENGFAQK